MLSLTSAFGPIGSAGKKIAANDAETCHQRRFPAFKRSWAIVVLAFNAALWPQISSNAQELVQLSEPATPLELLEARFKETELRLRALEASIQSQADPSQALFPADATNPTNAQGLQYYTSRQTEPSFDPQDAAALGQTESSKDSKSGESKSKDGSGSGEKKSEDKDAKKSDKKDEKKDEKKKKTWFEKYTLRGYAQFRINETLDLQDGSFPSYLPGDSSVGDNQSFLLRRARLIFSGDMSEHLGVYLQPDFAASIPGINDQIKYVQIRDWYSDLYLDTGKVHRLRIGQSKIPYGWENMQSSSNRLSLDRNDAFNSAARNERDLGVFYYWTPKSAQDFFKYTIDEGLKGSGNYGIFGLGVYNGQGGSFREQNDNLHVVARFTLPRTLPNGQLYELGIQGYTGDYNVLTSPVSPLGTGSLINPFSKSTGYSDERIGWSGIYYPQPLGFQAEWNVGRGPALNAKQTAIEEQSVKGGYAQTMYQYKSNYGVMFPFLRYQYFRGGYKTERNAPYARIDDYEIGLEWQMNSSAELTTVYTFADRTNTATRSQANTLSYGQFVGDVLRMQFQFNY